MRSQSGDQCPAMYCWAYCRYRSLSGKIKAGWYASSTTARSAAAHPATMSNGQSATARADSV